MNLSSIKKHYSQQGFRLSDLHDDPLQQFHQWLQDAIQSNIPEPNAMNLATVNPNGFPSIRAVLLKHYDDQGFVFLTNYQSDKAKDIDHNPHVALQFLWIPLDRQVRITGPAHKISQKDSQKYFQTRPRESQISSWASSQSSIIPSQEALTSQFATVSKKFHNQPVPLPPFWGGYCVKPTTFEFWKGKPNRLHDRCLYKKEGRGWKKFRLAP